MFCNACGTENIDVAAYCSACGAKLDNPVSPTNNNAESTFKKEQAAHNARTELAQMIYEIWQRVEPQSENYNLVRSTEQHMSRIKRSLTENESKTPEAKLGYAVIAAILGLMFCRAAAQNLDDPATQLFFVVIFLTPATAFFLAYRGAEQRKKQEKEQLDREMAACKKDAARPCTEIVANYNSIPNCLIDFKYADPGTLYMLYQIVSTGRADTLKEAILYFDELCHRQEMKDIALQQLNITRQIFDQTVEIRKSLRFIELMSTVNASTSSVVAASAISH